MAIEEISESKRKQIIKKSVDPLPNNPSKAGYKADEIKKAMFGFVTDEKDSIIAEINRIINEINFNFDNIDLSDYDTKEEVRNLIKDFITNNTNELENYYTKKQIEASLATNADLSKKYTDERVAGLINSAPETLDTFKEIADALAEDQSVIDALNEAIGLKASKKDLSATDEKVNRIESQLDDFVSTEELEKKDYATKSYVGENGGKIDSISVNGKPQQIDENKNLDITIPAYNDTKIKEDIEALQNDKVDKIEGKNLSSNDFTNEYKQKLEDLSNYDDTKIKEDIESLNTNKADKSEIPDVSEFITKGVNNLDNYYTKIQIDDKTEQAVNTAKNYTDTKVAELIDSAPETLDTFKEIADALKEDQDVLDTLNSAIGNKADKTALATTNAKVGALETDNATNKADIKELQENKADADDIPSNYVTTDTVQEVTGLKSFNDVQIKGTLMDNAGTRFSSLGMIQPKLTAGNGISIEGNTISSTISDMTVKDQSSEVLKPHSASGAMISPEDYNLFPLTERAIATGLPYFNGKHNYTDQTNYFVPTTSGKTGQILVANAENTNVYGGKWEDKQTGGEPEWKDPSDLGLLTEDNAVFMPVGSIFSSAIPQTDARVHLLDGSSISQSGIYAEFATLLKSLVSSGYKVSCTYSEYQSDIDNYGQCGRFVIDNNAGTIRLPKITKFVEGLTSLSNIGKSFKAGIPNITGQPAVATWWTVDNDVQGAFSTSGNRDICSNNNTAQNLIFDASRGETKMNGTIRNDVYGKSDTVQPQSTAYPYYIVLAGGYKSTEQVDIDRIANDLKTKLSKSDLYLKYPVGSIYISTNSTSPADSVANGGLGGGVWERLPEGLALWTTTTEGEGGNTIEAGLPNITGYIGWEKMGYLGGASSGALYFKESIGSWNAESGGSAGWNGSGIAIDANRVNNIYGRSTTVQPPAYKVFAWKRVG